MSGYSNGLSFTKRGDLVRSYTCSISGSTTEEVMTTLEQIFASDVLTLELVKDEFIQVTYLDDGGSPVLDSFSELLSIVPIEELPGNDSFLRWLVVCSDLLRSQNICPAALLCCNKKMVAQALGLDDFYIGGNDILGYSLIVDSSIDDPAIFLLGTRTARSDPMDAKVMYRYELAR